MAEQIYECFNVTATKKQEVVDSNNNPTNGVASSNEAKDYDFEKGAFICSKIIADVTADRFNFQSHNTLQRWYVQDPANPTVKPVEKKKKH